MSERKKLLNPVYFAERHYRIKPRAGLIKYEPWEKKICRDLFPDGNRTLPYSLFLLSIPKKLGKTEFITSLIAWHLWTGWADSPGMALVLFVANSKSQTEILGFEKLKYAIRQNEFLSGSCTIYKDAIETSSGSVARVLSSKSASAAGGEPSFVFMDEIHSGNEAMINKLFGELTDPGTRQFLMTIASYAGYNKQTLLYDLILLSEKGTDKKFYSYIGHDPMLSKRPGRAEYLESEKLRLGASGEFARIHENRFVDKTDVYIPSGDWQNCYDPDLLPLAPCKDKALTLGIDVAARRDCSSIIATYEEDDLVKVAFTETFYPPEGDAELDLESTVAHTIRWLSENYRVISVNFDERYMLSISQRLASEGVGGQWNRVSVQRASMAPIFENLRQGVKRRALRHFGDKDLDIHVGNAVIETTSSGIIVRKPTKSQKVDAVVALALSCKDSLSGKAKKEIVLMRGGDLRQSQKVPTRGDWAKPQRASLADKFRAMDRGSHSMADWQRRLRGR